MPKYDEGWFDEFITKHEKRLGYARARALAYTTAERGMKRRVKPKQRSRGRLKHIFFGGEWNVI